MLKFIINLENDLTREVPVKEGLIIGRSKGDIIIDDKRISSKHAVIKTNEAGHFFLQDLGSSNGLHVGGIRVKEALIIPGVEIKIGNTILTIAEIEIENAPEELTQEKVPLLDGFDFKDHDLPSDSDLYVFEKPIKFQFIRGPLNKAKWELFWGPIEIGSFPGPYSFVDKEIPKEQKLFQITKTTNAEALFIKKLGSVDIRVNGTNIGQNGLVENGDLIEIAGTAFKVSI